MTNSQSAERLKRPVTRSALGLPLSKAWTRAWEALFARRLAIYVFVLLVASIGAYAYWVRTDTIFACQADGYSADRYLAYCNGANYADYEHGAFQFNLEPSVQKSVRNADVLFLGDSRLQIALSTAPTAHWFASHPARYYLMGFSYYENAFFEGALLRRIHPRAKVYVINVNDFFVRSQTIPVHMILHDPKAREKYEAKRFWQQIHEHVCKTFAWLCGHQFVIFRSRKTGAYYTEGAVGPKEVAISYDPVVNQKVVDDRIPTAIQFLSSFTRGKCVILTIVPYVGTEIATAKAIARAVGLHLVTPGTLEGLHTFDGYHLDQPSARRWSEAFFKVAGPLIRSCLDNQNIVGWQGPTATMAARLTSGPAASR
jgi:hypothetical protein